MADLNFLISFNLNIYEVSFTKSSDKKNIG